MFIDPVDNFTIVNQRQSHQREIASAGRFPRVVFGVIERLPRLSRHLSSVVATYCPPGAATEHAPEDISVLVA